MATASCGGDDSSSITATGAPLSTPSSANGAPTISGRPDTSVQAGSTYSFAPIALDPEGATLSFSVSSAPAWASFNSSTGVLAGTPTAADIGNYSNIVISVSDGVASRSLPPFSISVISPGTGTGTATLRWNAPAYNTDGTPLTNLAGYRIYHGARPTALNDVRSIGNPGITLFVFDNLASGTHYFAISAVNSFGVEGTRSSALGKTVP